MTSPFVSFPGKLPKDILGALETIDYEHHEIHESNHYFFTDTSTVGNGTTVEYIFKPANATPWPHFLWIIQSTLKTTIQWYKNPTHTLNVQQTTYNNDFNSGNTATLEIWTHNADGADGSLFFPWVIGSTGAGGNTGGFFTRGTEWILKQNETVLLKLTSGANNNDINRLFEWYEPD